MSTRILINVVKTNQSRMFNAADKARKDVETTLTRNGYEVINIPLSLGGNKMKAILGHLIAIKKALNSIKKHNPQEIIIQYPGFRLGIKSISFILRFLKNRNITLLVHDIDSLRFHRKVSEKEVSVLKKATRIILHTDRMKEHLQKNGVNTPMSVMWLFDYYANGSYISKPFTKPFSVIFAGNLAKSTFLEKLNEMDCSFPLYLYGLPTDYNWTGNIKYMGKFAPDDIDGIQGNWGLVWDGDSLDECSGHMGNYLRYNSSHKTSLYIAAGKPVIVWSKSALAPYIVDNNLGITIDTIRDIPGKLSEISEEQYKLFRTSVESMGKKLREGKMLENIL
ncbi:MAG: hypothetical protein HDS62_06415 [Bacteroidales bacterium]|nr:hypothetical protein [Bacteroidales bacterium]